MEQYLALEPRYRSGAIQYSDSDLVIFYDTFDGDPSNDEINFDDEFYDFIIPMHL